MKNYLLVVCLLVFNIFTVFSQGENTFFGTEAGLNNSGTYSSGFGVNSLINSTSHSNNAFGFGTLMNTSGGFNCAFGNDALKYNSSGRLNNAFGTRSLENNKTGSENVAFGHRTLESNIFGNGNTSIGYGSLLFSTGSMNIALGRQAGRSLAFGNSNIFIGNDNGTNLIKGYFNVFIGNVKLENTASTSLIAGNSTDRSIILADGAGNQRLFISRYGNTGLGLGNNIIPRNRLDVNGGVVIGRNYVPSNSDSGNYVAPTNGLLVEGKVGIGTYNPKNKLEVTHGTEGNSGLRFTNLTSSFNPTSSQTSDKFLSVNQNGDVVLQRMANSTFSNVLSSNENTLTSNVNGISSNASIVNTISNSLNSNNQLVTMVNGVSSTPITIPIVNNTDSQALTINGNTISISGGNSIILPDTDEQTLALNGNVLSILNGNSVTLPTFTNTDSQSLTLNGNTISISGGNSISLPTLTDTDEQTLALNGNVLSILNGNSVTLPTFTNTDSQSLTLNGNTISISGGNSITIPTPTFAIIPGTNTTITGNGSNTTPFQINANDTSLYANDGEINQATTTGINRIVDLNDRNLWFDTSSSSNNGKMYIGSSPDYVSSTGNYKLFVEGGIMTEKVKVALRSTNNWADYVFEKEYNLRPLSEVEQFVNQNKHLPGIPSAQELFEKGIDVSEMQSKQMEKIEELTLYIIDQNKKLEQQNGEIQVLKSQMNELIKKMK